MTLFIFPQLARLIQRIEIFARISENVKDEIAEEKGSLYSRFIIQPIFKLLKFFFIIFVAFHILIPTIVLTWPNSLNHIVFQTIGLSFFCSYIFKSVKQNVSIF